MKVVQLDDLAKIVEQKKSDGQKIVHCHGVFDLLHIGHIRYFEQAKKLGDILVVTITPDRFVDKGPHRPAFEQELRAEGVASLQTVDFVSINLWPTATDTLRLLKPDIYVKGAEFKNLDSDLTGKIGVEAEVVKEIGAELCFTEDIVFSSTNLINRYVSNFPDEVSEYLKVFRSRYDLDEIIGMVDMLADLDVLVIGDTILDEYHYCEAIGKSSKDPVLAVKYQSKDVFAGGVLAVANHVANFVNSVKLVTVVGSDDNKEGFIRAELKENVEPLLIRKAEAPTIVKQRFIDGESVNKLFEVYVMDDSYLSTEEDDTMCSFLNEVVSEYDLVIAADFGHGAISKNAIKILCDKAKFLSVNTQANSSNRGHHTITKYPSADLVCLAEHEIRLETRDKDGELRPLMESVAEKIGLNRLVVTRGRRGSLVHGAGDFVAVPTFAQNIVDRIGAGDSLFALTSLIASQCKDNELIGFLGNIAGSLAVTILGNQRSIDSLSVKKYITSLMK